METLSATQSIINVIKKEIEYYDKEINSFYTRKEALFNILNKINNQKLDEGKKNHGKQ